MSELLAEDLEWALYRSTLIHPYPVAVASRRILYARTLPQRVGCCIKGGEILARYMAAVALASFAARDEEEMERSLTGFQGNLAFGSFLTMVQEIAKFKVNHPAKDLLLQGFKRKGHGPTDKALVELLQLRNTRAHDLQNLDEAGARAITSQYQPVKKFLDALSGSEELLKRPLFLIENQKFRGRKLICTRLLLMGDSANPRPEQAELKSHISDEDAPHIAIDDKALALPPSLIWGVDKERRNFTVLFVDGLTKNGLRYRTLDGTRDERGEEELHRLLGFIGGALHELDEVKLEGDSNFDREWQLARERLEEAGLHAESRVPWDDFDDDTMAWWASKLEGSFESPREAIDSILLDERPTLPPEEINQLTILFGKPPRVRACLQRDLLDLRVIDGETLRPRRDEGGRELIESDNLLVALKKAVEFFAKNTGLEDIDPERLQEMNGSVDYISLREVLINQFIHQDYSDETTAGQIEIWPSEVRVFNAGASLVPQEQLVRGGKSQSRNPTIARALRAIDFAETSGSGIRAMYRACEQAGRRAPAIDSDEEHNTFTLILSWANSPRNVDEYWRSRIGVDLSPRQATVLNLLNNVPSTTLNGIQAETSMELSELEEILDYLEFQGLLARDEANFSIAEHLKDIPHE